jgi:hypothetical protein
MSALRQVSSVHAWASFVGTQPILSDDASHISVGKAPASLTLLMLGPLPLVIEVVYETRMMHVAILPFSLFRSLTEGRSSCSLFNRNAGSD